LNAWDATSHKQPDFPVLSLFLAQSQALFDRGVSALFLDGIDCAHHHDRLLRDLGSHLFRIDHLAPEMGPGQLCIAMCIARQAISISLSKTFVKTARK
jgi:hypothetical protein